MPSVSIDRYDEELEEEYLVEVEYRLVGRYYPATHYEPATYPEVEILSAELADGTKVVLTEKEQQYVTDYAHENPEDDSDYRFELARDRRMEF
jgi:hypothetical protein